MTSDQPLIDPLLLFHVAVPCLRRDPVWTAAGIELDEAHRIPTFGELIGRRVVGDLRAAWSPDGLTFVLRVSGKRRTPWCRQSAAGDSDGLHVLLATRPARQIRRANRFCHRFAFLPMGGGARKESPVAMVLPIQGAREPPRPIQPGSLAVRSERRADGYLLQAHVGAGALTGYEPTEHPRLGFAYLVIDQELGWQTLTVGPELPLTEDPSLWGELELVGR